MNQRRHLQLHQERRRQSGEKEVAHREELALKLAKRQQSGGLKDAWDDFTEGVKEAFGQTKTTTEDNPDRTTSSPQATTTVQQLARPTPSSTSRTSTTVTKTEVQSRAATPPLLLASSTESTKSDADSTSDNASTATMPASIAAPTETSAIKTDAPLAVAKNTPTLIQTSATPTPTNAASTTDNSGNAASKAGIAFGVIGGLLAISLLVFFLFKKRKQQIEKRRLEDEDEKLVGAFAAVPSYSTRRSSRMKAPRLSLRPTTAFDASLNRQPTLPHGANGAPPTYPKNAGSAWERPSTGNGANNPANPFGNHAERMEGSGYPPGPVAGLVGAGMQSGRKDAPEPLDLTLCPPPGLGAAGIPPSPAGTEYSMQELSPGATAPSSAGAAAIAAAGGPAQSGVHRVQLDFKPTMDDEMELKAGTLVRLLFEYDDGWAACIRLDRSQQGVVPRTCLSTRPLKPRPTGPQRQGPPINPYRGGSPPVTMQTQGHSPTSPVKMQHRIPSPTGMGPMRQPQQQAQSGHSRGQRSIERKPVPGEAL